MTETTQDSAFVSWARDELTRAGLFDKDSDYEGMIGEAVMRLVETFDEEGHPVAAQIFARLSNWKTLTPLTDDPDEWQDVAGEENMWQSRRRPDAFSWDGGKTYYCLDDPENFRPGTVEDIDPDGGSDEPPVRVSKPPAEYLIHRSEPS